MSSFSCVVHSFLVSLLPSSFSFLPLFQPTLCKNIGLGFSVSRMIVKFEGWVWKTIHFFLWKCIWTLNVYIKEDMEGQTCFKTWIRTIINGKQHSLPISNSFSFKSFRKKRFYFTSGFFKKQWHLWNISVWFWIRTKYRDYFAEGTQTTYYNTEKVRCGSGFVRPHSSIGPSWTTILVDWFTSSFTEHSPSWLIIWSLVVLRGVPQCSILGHLLFPLFLLSLGALINVLALFSKRPSDLFDPEAGLQWSSPFFTGLHHKCQTMVVLERFLFK